MYGLLNDNPAENARKEVLLSEFSMNQQVCEKEKRETNVLRR